MSRAKAETLTKEQKAARQYLKRRSKKVTPLLEGILVFDGLSELKARLIAKELVEAAASLARGKGW